MLPAFFHGEGLLFEWLGNAALVAGIIVAGFWLIFRHLRGR